MRKLELFVIVLVGLLTIIEYSLPAPIVPLEMNRRHISQTSTGVALAAYSFGINLTSFLPT